RGLGGRFTDGNSHPGAGGFLDAFERTIRTLGVSVDAAGAAIAERRIDGVAKRAVALCRLSLRGAIVGNTTTLGYGGANLDEALVQTNHRDFRCIGEG